jgi:hypothetical protein
MNKIFVILLVFVCVLFLFGCTAEKPINNEITNGSISDSLNDNKITEATPINQVEDGLTDSGGKLYDCETESSSRKIMDCYKNQAIRFMDKEICLKISDEKYQIECTNIVENLFFDEQILKGKFDFSCSEHEINYYLIDDKGNGLFNGRKIGTTELTKVFIIKENPVIVKTIDNLRYFITPKGVFENVFSEIFLGYINGINFDEKGNFYYMVIDEHNNFSLYKNGVELSKYGGEYRLNKYKSGIQLYFGFRIIDEDNYLLFGISGEKEDKLEIYHNGKKLDYYVKFNERAAKAADKFDLTITGKNFAFTDDRGHLIFNNRDLGGEVKDWTMNENNIFYVLYDSNKKEYSLYLNENKLESSSDVFEMLTLGGNDYGYIRGSWHAHFYLNGVKQENTNSLKAGVPSWSNEALINNGNYFYKKLSLGDKSLIYNAQKIGGAWEFSWKEGKIFEYGFSSDGKPYYSEITSPTTRNFVVDGKILVENIREDDLFSFYNLNNYYYIKKYEVDNRKKYDYYYNGELIIEGVEGYSFQRKNDKGFFVESQGKAYLNEILIGDTFGKTIGFMGSDALMGICN